MNSNKTSLGEVQVSVDSLRNPWSFQNFGPITFDLMVNGDLSQSCTDVYSSVTETNILKTIVFSISNLQISTLNSNIRMIFIATNPFPKPDNRVKVSFPSSVTVSYSGSSTIFSQSATEIVFSSINSISIGNFSVTTPPSTRQFVFTFTTQSVVLGSAYDIDSSSLTYQCSPGTITGITVIPSSYIINEETTYSLTFTIDNALVTGSFIEITFPLDLSILVTGNPCDFTGHSCAINNANKITLTLLTAISALDSLTVTVNKVTNAN